MTSEELKRTRKSWGYSQSEFACLLQTRPRTYQDWEGGRGRIPGIITVTLGLLLERDERITAGIMERLRARILKEYPAGIPSEPDLEEEP